MQAELTREQLLAIKNAQHIFKPQPGGQTMFLSSPADFVLYGGQAGGGKTYGLLLECLRHVRKKGFNATIFRREMKQIKSPGGLWDESFNIFPNVRLTPNSTELRWSSTFGSSIRFCGLELESDVIKYQGGQIGLLAFDEITHFSDGQFSYMFSRNRGTSGVKSYIRATCNPDPTSWVKKFVEWYLVPTGTPDHSKRGIIRYFGRLEGNWVFGSSLEYMQSKYDLPPDFCNSYTFIYATLDDNPALLSKDPGYISRLNMLSPEDREALLYGNWNIIKAGKIFKQEDFAIFTQIPNYSNKLIVMDTAQKTKEANDYSVMQAWVKSDKGIYLVDQVRGKYEFLDLEMMAISFINRHSDGDVYIEDAVSGTALIQSLRRKLNRPINGITRKKDKYTRAFDAQGYVKSGFVHVNPFLDYFTDYINEMVAFNSDMSHKHDDQADCTFDAIDILLQSKLYENVQKRNDIQLSLSPRRIY